MIAILNYDPEGSEKSREFLNSLGIENEITKNEKVISSADKLLLPDCNDVLKILKKIQLYNLHSLVKVLNKPVLGINRGALLMAGKVINACMPGLGFFECEFDVIKQNITSDEVIIEQNENSPGNLLKKPRYVLPAGEKLISLNQKKYITYYYNINGEKLPAIIENNHRYAVFFDPFQSRETGEEIILSFNDIG